jgi:hypothetical protein
MSFRNPRHVTTTGENRRFPMSPLTVISGLVLLGVFAAIGILMLTAV